MNIPAIALIALGVVCVLAFAVLRLRRASRWVDATLQDHRLRPAQHPTAPAPDGATGPHRLPSHGGTTA